MVAEGLDCSREYRAPQGWLDASGGVRSGCYPYYTDPLTRLTRLPAFLRDHAALGVFDTDTTLGNRHQTAVFSLQTASSGGDRHHPTVATLGSHVTFRD